MLKAHQGMNINLLLPLFDEASPLLLEELVLELKMKVGAKVRIRVRVGVRVGLGVGGLG
jgi:hypothetical protein